MIRQLSGTRKARCPVGRYPVHAERLAVHLHSGASRPPVRRSDPRRSNRSWCFFVRCVIRGTPSPIRGVMGSTPFLSLRPCVTRCPPLIHQSLVPLRGSRQIKCAARGFCRWGEIGSVCHLSFPSVCVCRTGRPKHALEGLIGRLNDREPAPAWFQQGAHPSCKPFIQGGVPGIPGLTWLIVMFVEARHN